MRVRSRTKSFQRLGFAAFFFSSAPVSIHVTRSVEGEVALMFQKGMQGVIGNEKQRDTGEYR